MKVKIILVAETDSLNAANQFARYNVENNVHKYAPKGQTRTDGKMDTIKVERALIQKIKEIK